MRSAAKYMIVFLVVAYAGLCCSLAGTSDQSAAFANDFPGRGDPAQWKESQKYYESGLKAKETQQWATAVFDLSKAIRIYPYDITYYVARMDAFKKTGEYKSATQDAATAIVMSNGNWMYWLFLAEIAYFEEDWLKCRKACNSAANGVNSKASQDREILNSRINTYKTRAGSRWPNTSETFAVNDVRGLAHFIRP